MPTVFRITCSNCGKHQETTGEVAGFFSPDGKTGGQVIPEGFLALKLPDGNFLCLPHPIEGSALENNGYSFDRAIKEGCLFSISFKVCTECGQLHEEKQHVSSNRGCLPAMVAVLAFMLTLRFVLDFTWSASFLSSLVFTLILLALAEYVHSLRWNKENALLKVVCCSRCNKPNMKSLGQLSGKTIPCPFCGRRSVQIDIAGRS